MHAILVILAVGGLMHAARSFLPPDADDVVSGTALAFGFVLIVAFFAGRLFRPMRLPQLTGYILAGLVAGPAVLDLITRDMVRALGPVQGTAICLIALTAGGELNIRRMRPLMRTITSMTLWVVLGSAISIALAVFAMRGWLPFMDGLGSLEVGAVSAVLGVSLAAMSPAVVMALLGEMRADGPLSKTMLGVVVAADLAVIVLFAVIAAPARAVLSGSSDFADALLHLSWELFGSAIAGVGVGSVIALYLRKVHQSRALFVLLTCVIVAEVGSRLALDPLIVTLTAGLFMENVWEVETTELIHEIESASLPVYVVFFAVTGAALRLDVLATVAVPALVLVGVRLVAIWVGSAIAARRSGADATVRRWAFTGYLPQAGLALALLLLFPKVLPGMAEAAAALVLGIVAINQIVMPPLLRIALLRAKESDRATPHDVSRPEMGEQTSG